MTEFEAKIAYSTCCGATITQPGVRTLLETLTVSPDMKCSHCNKEIMPHEINWREQYKKIANGIYRKIN